MAEVKKNPVAARDAVDIRTFLTTLWDKVNSDLYPNFAWQDGGDGFLVKNTKDEEKYENFRRNLYLWGFKKGKSPLTASTTTTTTDYWYHKHNSFTKSDAENNFEKLRSIKYDDNNNNKTKKKKPSRKQQKEEKARKMEHETEPSVGESSNHNEKRENDKDDGERFEPNGNPPARKKESSTSNPGGEDDKDEKKECSSVGAKSEFARDSMSHVVPMELAPASQEPRRSSSSSSSSNAVIPSSKANDFVDSFFSEVFMRKNPPFLEDTSVLAHVHNSEVDSQRCAPSPVPFDSSASIGTKDQELLQEMLDDCTISSDKPRLEEEASAFCQEVVPPAAPAWDISQEDGFSKPDIQELAAPDSHGKNVGHDNDPHMAKAKEDKNLHSNPNLHDEKAECEYSCFQSHGVSEEPCPSSDIDGTVCTIVDTPQTNLEEMSVLSGLSGLPAEEDKDDDDDNNNNNSTGLELPGAPTPQLSLMSSIERFLHDVPKDSLYWIVKYNLTTDFDSHSILGAQFDSLVPLLVEQFRFATQGQKVDDGTRWKFFLQINRCKQQLQDLLKWHYWEQLRNGKRHGREAGDAAMYAMADHLDQIREAHLSKEATTRNKARAAKRRCSEVTQEDWLKDPATIFEYRMDEAVPTC